MANVLGELFGDIANAIRTQTGDTGTMKPTEFASRIENIQSDISDYNLHLAESLMTRDAEYLSGDATVMNMRGFVTSTGRTLANLSGYSFAGFREVEGMVFDQVLMVNENAFADNTALKILDITATSGLAHIIIDPGALNGCTALEAIICRDGGAGLINCGVSSSNGANETFYVYIPSQFYDTVVSNLSSSTISSERYRKLEDYPVIDYWNRKYTVKFYDGDTLVDTKIVKYGETASSTYTKTGYKLGGWTPEPVNVTSDMDCYGEWGPESFSGASWEDIVATSEAGKAQTYFALGDTKELSFTDPNGTSWTVNMVISGFNHDTLADGSGKAGISLTTELGTFKARINDKDTNSGASVVEWGTCELRSNLNNVVYTTFPEALQNAIKSVQKKHSYYNRTTSTEVFESENDKVWILSAGELGLSSTTNYTVDDSDSYAYFNKSKTDSSGNKATYWLRNGYKSGGHYWVYYDPGTGYGRLDSPKNGNSYVIFGFCI